MNARFVAAASALVLVAGCSGLPERLNTNIDQTDSKASTLVKDVGRSAPGVVVKRMATSEHDNGIWLSKNIVKIGQPALPPVFYESATFDRQVNSLTEVAERLTLRSGIPTKISPDALVAAGGMSQGGNASQTAPSSVPALTGNPASTGMSQGASNAGRPRGSRIVYANGDFKGLLDTVAARYGVYWKYVNGTVQFYHTDSRTFQINAIPGDSTFSATVTSGATSTGGVAGGAGGANNGVSSTNSQNTGVKSQLSVYSSIEKSILAILSSHGKVVSSPATGTITVVDTPDTLDRVAAFIENENKSLLRQITINVTVLAVTMSKGDDYGINWNLVYEGLLSKYGIQNTVAAAGGTAFSAGILRDSGSKFAGSTLLIKALSEQGKVRRETTASVVTLNNQPVPVQVAKQSSYLASSQTTLTSLVGATTTLTPGIVTSGFNMSILPHVLNNGTVMLQFSTDISALRGFRLVTSNGSSIESPEMETRNFLQRVAMKSNETLIISGFEQTDENLDQSGVGDARNFALGGGYKGKSNKEVIVILITPTTMSGS